jgi:mycofactocin precursor peptide peptidase
VPDAGRETRLGVLTWPEVQRRDALLAVPVGSLEQHGPHLPLDTDTRIAVAVAAGLAERRGDTVVAPAAAYGSSGEHQAFPGTLSIGQSAVEMLLVELVRSAAATFAATVLVNCHGGNTAAVTAAVRMLRGEGRQALGWQPRLSGGDSHAGRAETSLLLALAPDLVRRQQCHPGNLASLPELMPALRAGALREVAPTGVLGDPTAATPAEGQRLLAALVADLDSAVRGWLPPPPPAEASASVVGRPAGPVRVRAGGTGRAADRAI